MLESQNQLESEHPLTDNQLSDQNEDSQILIQKKLHAKLINIINEQKLVIEKLETEISKEKEEKENLQQIINQKDLQIQNLGNNKRKLEAKIIKQFSNLQTNLQSNLKIIDKMEKFAKQFSNEEEEEKKENENENQNQEENKEEEEEIKEKEEEEKNENENHEENKEEEKNKDSALLSLNDVSPDQVKINIFNELCLNLQLIVISKIFPEVANNSMTLYFINITNLLIYLMQFTPEDSKCLSILAKNTDQLLIELEKEEEVNVLYNVTERLFLSDSLESSEFIHHLNQFKSISIEMKYPSEFFNQIYYKIKRLKKTVMTNLDMAVFITGIKRLGVFFRNDNNINIVRMDSSVKEIENGFLLGGAFYNCRSLRKVTISSSVSYIGDNIFRKCRALTDLTIPPSVVRFDFCPFEDCRSLEEVDLPSSVIEIGLGTFAFCLSLKSPKIPNSVIEIGISAFQSCRFTHITIPSSVRILCSTAFLDCELLDDVEFEDHSSLRKIGQNAFKGCKSLKKIEFPPSLVKIESEIFKNCPQMEEVTIYSTLYDIDKNAFPPNVKINKIFLYY